MRKPEILPYSDAIHIEAMRVRILDARLVYERTVTVQIYFSWETYFKTMTLSREINSYASKGNERRDFLLL